MSGIIINININVDEEEGSRIDSADAISGTLLNKIQIPSENVKWR